MDFLTSTDTMRQQAHMCKSITSPKDNNQEEEEYENDNNSN